MAKCFNLLLHDFAVHSGFRNLVVNLEFQINKFSFGPESDHNGSCKCEAVYVF